MQIISHHEYMSVHPLACSSARKCLIKYPFFATFGKLYAEFCKKLASRASPLSEDMFVFGHSKVSASFMLNFA